MTLNVIDVSRYQAGINMPAMKAAGCNAVIVGATYGTAGINPAAFAQLDGTKAAGMLRGVYHIRARQNTTAIQEANYFLNHIRGYLDGSTLPVLDWEECDTSDEAWALAWLNEVYRQTGIRPWFYVNLSDILKYKYPRIAAAGYAVWLAYYPYNTVDGFQGVGWTPQPIPAGHTLAAWQYVGTGGSLAGYQGLDLSVAYLTAKGWNAYARPQLTTDASTVTPIKETTLSAAEVTQIKTYIDAAVAKVNAYTAALLIYGYNSGGIKHPGIGPVVEENQRRINTANAGIKTPAPVALTDAQVQQIIAAVPTANLAALKDQFNK